MNEFGADVMIKPPAAASRITELPVASPEQVKLTGLAKLFGAEFALAYQAVKPISIAEFVQTPQSDLPNNMTRDFAYDLKQERIHRGTIRLLQVTSRNSKESETSYTRVYGVVENDIVSDDSDIANPGVSAMTVFNLGLNTSKDRPLGETYAVDDIVWINDAGETLSYLQDNNIGINLLVRLGWDPNKVADSNIRDMIVPFPSSERNISVIAHEGGHAVNNEATGNRKQYTDARTDLSELVKHTDPQTLTSMDPEPYKDKLDLTISDEQKAWVRGMQIIEAAINRGFPIISGDVEGKVTSISRRFLFSYESFFSILCNRLNRHFITQ